MKVDRIKPGTFTGYIWKSDEEYPEVLMGAERGEQCFDDDSNPFVIEARLFDETTLDSYSVRYIDGRHIISVERVSELEASRPHKDELVFIGNKMQGHDLVFNQYYRSVPDELCEGMETLREAECVFVGFKQ